MKNIKLKFKLFFSLMILTSLLSTNVFSEEGNIVLSNKVFKQVIKKDKKGKVTYDYIEPGLAVPGDVMMYVISFENRGKETAKGIVVNDPIPNNSKYRIGSAKGKNTKITFSVDGGKNYGDPKKLIVKDKDGKEWQAKPESYTHIRWVYNKSLAAGMKAEVSFKTQIKGNE